MELRVDHTQDRTLVIHVRGRLDVKHIDDLKSQWAQSEARHIIIDLSETTFIDSMGLASLVSGLKTARQRGGNLILVNPSPPVQLILDLTAMAKVFLFADTVSGALGQIS